MPILSVLPFFGQSSATTQDEDSGKNPDIWMQIALIAGCLILVAGGMDQALGLGWNIETHVESTVHFQICWFVAAIVGNLVSTPFVYILSKRIFVRFSAVLITITGIIYLSAPRHYGLIIAARYISGFAVGWITTDFLVHASELALPKNRGSFLGLEQTSISIGIGIQVIYGSQWTKDTTFDANRLHGIFVLLLGLLAYSFTWLIIESPIFHLRNLDGGKALVTQKLVVKSTMIDKCILLTLEDNRNYVTESTSRGYLETIIDALFPAVKVLLLRSIVTFTFSLPLNWIMKVSSSAALGYDAGWPAVMLALLRILSVLSSLNMLDTNGRKKLAFSSLLIIGLMSMSIGGMTTDGLDCNMARSCTATILYQIFTGFYVTSTSAFLGEAFPILLKPYLIASCVICDYLLQIILIVTFEANTDNALYYMISSGLFMLASCAFFYIFLPETRWTSLREAQNHFRRPYNCYLP